MGKKPKGGDMWDDLLESGDGMLSPSKPKGKRRFRRLKKKKSMLHLDFSVSFMPLLCRARQNYSENNRYEIQK